MLATARRRREPDRRAPATARTSARPRRSARALGASVERIVDDATGERRRTVVASPGVDGLRAAGGRPRLRQLRDEPPAVRRDPRRPALPERPRRRRFIAPPSGRSYHRTAALDGCGAPRPIERLPSAGHRDRSHPAPRGRRLDDRPERPGQVGDPPGRASGGRPDDGPGVGRDARPHGADAPGAGRARSRPSTDGRRTAASRSVSKEGRRCWRSTSGSRATSRRRRSGSSRARSTRTPSSPSAASASTRRGGPSSTSWPRWAPISTSVVERPDGRRSATASRSPTSRPLERAPRHRPRPARRRRRDRRDPGPVPRRAARRRHDAIRGAGELRHKESDRIAGIAAGLARSARGSTVDGDDLRDPRPGRRFAARRPTASTTTASR